MVKKIKRSRSSKIEIMSMYGEEPTFDDFDDLSEDEQKVRYGKAMYWYHGVYSSKDSKSFIVDYVKKNRKKDLPSVKMAAPAWASPAYGNVAKAFNSGYKSDKVLTKLENYIDGLVKTGKGMLADKKKVQTLQKKRPALNIQERIRSQVSVHIGELEGELDEFILGGCKKSEFSLYKWLQKNEVKGVHTGHIKNFYVDVLDEFQQALDATDPQLVEAYAFLTISQKKKLIEFVQSFVSDAEAWVNVAKTQRKPRTKKTQSTKNKVAKVKYKKADNTYKIASINPEQMVDATQVWLFNTKDRFLYRYVSVQGMMIKGTTLQGWDEIQSFKKKIRKPENILPDVVKGGKIKLRKLMDDIHAKKGNVTGRINKDMVILRVV